MPSAQTLHNISPPHLLRKHHTTLNPHHVTIQLHQTPTPPNQYYFSNMPPFWTIGTLFGASSVMIGAFGAHGLKKRIADPARIGNWSTAAQYQVLTPFSSKLLLLHFPRHHLH
jgi:hypothetical protein